MTAKPRYELRPATGADHAALYTIHREAMRPHVEATWGPWDERVQPSFFQATIDRGLLQVVLVKGETAGLLEVDDRFATVYVQNIELSAAHRGAGLGTAILLDIQAKATAGGKRVELQVLKVNPARRLYERLGFVATGETETHVQMEWRPG